MTIILNTCFGGFHIPTALCDLYGFKPYAGIARNDPRLVDFVLRHGGQFSERCAELTAVEIPDTATDYTITEYDGLETLIYVVDGKLHFVDGAE